MIADGPYAAMPVSRRLLVAGAWDDALALLDGPAGPEVQRLRARILVERNWWRLDDPGAARDAVAALPEGDAYAAFLGAQLAYTRLLFGLDAEEGDADLAEEGFRAGAAEPATAGWGQFWLGVLREHIHEDDEAARPFFDEALRRCRDDGDLLLESYVVRHLSSYEADPVLLLRRSLHLRAALGARPQAAAAQVTLAGELPEGAERASLLEAARFTAEELSLTWLSGFLD
jgi:hypothetical protein